MSLENNPFITEVAAIKERQLEEKNEDLRRIVNLLTSNGNKIFTNIENSRRETDKKKLAGQLN